jgi:hypothetical protein
VLRGRIVDLSLCGCRIWTDIRFLDVSGRKRAQVGQLVQDIQEMRRGGSMHSREMQERECWKAAG